MQLDTPDQPVQGGGASGSGSADVPSLLPARSAEIQQDSSPAAGLAGLVDEALLAARSWIASEIHRDDQVAVACAAIRLSNEVSEGLGLAVESCCSLAGMDGGAILYREDGQLRVAGSHDLPPSLVAVFEGFGSAGSPLLPGSGDGIAVDLGADAAGGLDFLGLGLQRAGVRAYWAFPLPLEGRGGAAVLCLFSSSASAPRQDRLPRVRRACTQLADSIDRRRASDAIAQREANLRAIVDTVTEGILTIDGSGRIRSANPAIGRILGYSPDELVGRRLVEVIPDRDRPAAESGLERYLAGTERRVIGRPIEVAALRRDGTEVTVEIVVSEVEPRRLFTAVMRDVTERRAADSRLRQSDRMASLGALAAGLGHDMNNVLFPIRAHLNALSADGAAPGADARRDHVEQIQAGVRYLQQLADGLHYLVHEPGHADGGLDGAVLAEWWAGTGALLSRSLPPLTRVEVDIDADLPRVRVTEHALTQSVLNLFVNAGEAIAMVRQGADGLVRIAAHAAPDGRSIVLSVSDNGLGMDEDVRRRAFDMFFTTKVRGMGTGLGLAMVNRVAREAGGDASIASVPGEGATVSLRLPLAAGEAELGGMRVAIGCMDGRAAAFIAAALRARGAVTVGEPDAEAADAWLADPRIVDARAVRAWRLRRPGRTVVQLGVPHRSQREAWAGLADRAIRSIADFDALLVGVDRACAVIQRRRNDARGNSDVGGAGIAGADSRPQEGDQPHDRPRPGGGARARRR